MNIIAVCELLGDNIQISSVRFGAHVIHRVNMELPVAQHLTETLTGAEIREKLDVLAPQLRNGLYGKAMLSPLEISEFVDDIAQLRKIVTSQHVEEDRIVETYLGYVMLVIFIVAIAHAMQYVFVVTSNEDVLTGQMVSAMKYLFSYIFE